MVDFYCHKAALVVEVDGDIHDQQAEYDQEREQILKDIGLRIMRIKNEEIEKDITGALERVRQAALPLPESGRGPGG